MSETGGQRHGGGQRGGPRATQATGALRSRPEILTGCVLPSMPRVRSRGLRSREQAGFRDDGLVHALDGPGHGTGTTPVTEQTRPSRTLNDSGTAITAGQSLQALSETATNGTVVGNVATTGDEATGFADYGRGTLTGAFAIGCRRADHGCRRHQAGFRDDGFLTRWTIQGPRHGTTPVTERPRRSYVTDSGYGVITAGQSLQRVARRRPTARWWAVWRQPGTKPRASCDYGRGR